MPAAKKVIFDSFACFDEIKEEEVIVEEVVEEIEELEEIIPTFSEEQVAAARKEGIAAGREQERAEILGAIEQQTMKTLALIEKRIGELLNIQEQANEAIQRDCLVIATAVVQRLFPSLNQEHAQREVEDMIASVMTMVIEEPRVTVKVNEKLHASLEKRITEITAKKGFEGKLTVLSDQDIQIGDCKIEWGKGGAVRDMDALWREIDAVIERKTLSVAGTPTVSENKVQEDTELEVTDDEMPNIDMDSANGYPVEENAADSADSELVNKT